MSADKYANIFLRQMVGIVYIFLRQMEPGYCLCARASTIGLKRSHTSTVKMVALLLNAEESEDIRAAIMTAIIRPTIPIGRTFRTSLESKNNDCQC